MGRDAVAELDRCLRQGNGFVGLGVPGAGFNVAANDPSYVRSTSCASTRVLPC